MEKCSKNILYYFRLTQYKKLQNIQSVKENGNI